MWNQARLQKYIKNFKTLRCGSGFSLTEFTFMDFIWSQLAGIMKDNY